MNDHFSFFNFLFSQLIIILLAATLFSCKRNLSEVKLDEYISNTKHGLVQEKVINNVSVRVLYKPPDLLAKLEVQSMQNPTKEKINEIMERYQGNYYFLLSVSPRGNEILSSAANRQWFSNMVSRLCFEMENFVKLISESQDTLKLITYCYPRMYGMSSSTDILFVFKQDTQLKNTDILTFKLMEFGLLTGDIKFRFRLKDIINAPKLKKIDYQ
jgi:hypothetical protein